MENNVLTTTSSFVLSLNGTAKINVCKLIVVLRQEDIGVGFKYVRIEFKKKTTTFYRFNRHKNYA
jgi:hypothetical protein